jgi:protease I
MSGSPADPTLSPVTRAGSAATASLGQSFALLCSALNIEQAEYVALVDAFRDSGATAHLISVDKTAVQGFDHLAKVDVFEADVTVASTSSDDYTGLVILNGVIGPYEVRMHEDALDLVRAFDRAGKPIYAPGHGVWVLIGAGLVGGRKITAWPNLRPDVERGGATWQDGPVVVDGNIVTSRQHPFAGPDHQTIFDLLTLAGGDFARGEHRSDNA